MASKPEQEEQPADRFEVDLGWTYDKALHQYFPCESTDKIKTEMCSPIFNFEIFKNDFLRGAVEKPDLKEKVWMQDYKQFKGDNIILLEGTKMIEKKGNIVADPKKYTVSSVCFMYHVDMLICSPYELKDNLLLDLKQYLYSMVNGSNISYIPNGLDINYFDAYIYPSGKNRKLLKPIKHALQEFCRLVMDSDVGKHPYSTNLIEPIPVTNMNSTYASVLKNSKTDTKEINLKNNLKMQKNLATVPIFYNTSENNFHLGSTRRNIADETRNQQNNSETSSMCGVNSVTAEKEIRMHENRNSLSGNECCFLGKGKEISSADESKELGKESKCSTNIQLTSHSEKQTHNSYPQSDSSRFHSAKQVCNSDHQSGSGLSIQDSSSSENFKTKVGSNVSNESNMSKANFLEHVDQSADDKKVFNLTPGNLKSIEETSNECGMTRKYYGVHSEKKQKTIILLGASGSGKTTLVNFVANYYRGVKSADDEMVHIVRNSNDVRSYTTSITAYTFCSSEHDTPITVIDTPGLNDSSGAEVRDHVQSLKTFLANAASQNLEIHAIGFVAQAHLVRLTSSERLVMDYVSTLFGQSIENHFFTFVTFADNQETPPVVEAMKNYGVKCINFFKFNNSALSNNKTDEIDDLDRVYWRIGSKSWKKCIKSLQNLAALSVNTLRNLQNEVFAGTVIESAERELRAELMVFINYWKVSKYMTKEAIHSCEKVWELVSVVHCFRSTHFSDLMDVECILVYFTEEICKENGINYSNCIQLLSLSATRSLLNAGISVVQSIAPLYAHAIEISNKHRKINSNIIPEFLYCHQCNEDHELKRIHPSAKWKLPFFGSNALGVTYVCAKCNCDGNLHGTKDNDSTKCSQSNSLDLNKLLDHTMKCIWDVVKEFSIPKYLVNVDMLLDYINTTTDHEFDEFIKHLLHVTRK